MATYGPLIDDGSQNVAGSDLSAKQFYAIKLTAARTLDLANTGGEATYGVLQNKPTLGQAVDAGILGITKAVAGGTCTAGGPLMTDNTGRFVDKTGGNITVLMAIEGATVAGQIITAKIVPTAG